MIFVTVGAQMPFDRLTRTMATWAKNNDIKVFAQIGNTSYKPDNIEYVNKLEPDEFRNYIKKSNLVVAHAGMGSILSVLELGKPLIILPRRGNLNETRNDHQLATAKYFSNHKNIQVVQDELELQEKLNTWKFNDLTESIGPHASDELLSTINSFLINIKNN